MRRLRTGKPNEHVYLQVEKSMLLSAKNKGNSLTLSHVQYTLVTRVEFQKSHSFSLIWCCSLGHFKA